MAGRPRERSAAALSIVPIWPPVYYYLAGCVLLFGKIHPFPRDQSLGGPSEAANSKWHLVALGILRHLRRIVIACIVTLPLDIIAMKVVMMMVMVMMVMVRVMVMVIEAKGKEGGKSGVAINEKT